MFADQLKQERERLGITQAQAAALCGVSLRAYGKWENGESTLQVTLEGALARLKATKAPKK